MAATIKIVVSSTASGNAIRDAQKDIREMDSTARNSGGGFLSMKNLGVAALGAVAAAAAGAALAVGKFVTDSIGAAANFESSINGLRAVTGSALEKAGFSMEDVSKKALQLGADTQFSAQQAVEAMTELAKGGVPIEAVMTDATDATLALAAATGMQLAPAAEIVAKQLGVWSETGVTAAQVTDLLASAANASVVDVDELALGLANAGGTAKTAGVSYQDLVQTMALIAPNFSSASDAGTSLKTFISRLIPTTDNATEAMIALGLATEDGKSKFFDAQGAFIGMEAASKLLQEQTAGLSQEEKLLAFNTIFGADAIRTAASIANAGVEGFNAMGQAMADSGGAAAASTAKNQGFSFALEQLKGSMETLQIVLGTMLLPILTEFLNNVVTPGVNKIMALVQAFAAGEISTESLAATWGAQFTYIRTVTEQVMAAIWAVISAVLNQIMIFWTAHGEEVMAFVQFTWDTIKQIIDVTLQLIQATIVPLLQGIAAFISAHGTEIQTYLSNTWTIIKNVIAAALILIKGIITAALQLIKGDFSGAWATIQQMSGQFVALLWGAIKAGLDNILLVWKMIWEQVKIFFQGIMDGIVGWVIQTLQGIVNAFNSFLGQARAAAGGVGDAIVDGISGAIEGGVSSIINAAKDAAMAALDAAKEALGIGSPSKLFAESVGLPMAQGMAVGLAGGAPLVASAGAMAAQSAYAGATSTVNNQRTMSLTQNYYGTPAAPAMDFATASSLAGL